jgi:hypothetical protein
MQHAEKLCFIKHDGEKEAWNILGGISPEDVCRRAVVSFDENQEAFNVKLFSASVSVYPRERTICGINRKSELLLRGLGDSVVLPILRYLIHALDMPLSGNLVNPAELKGGRIYVEGAHVLPLHLIAQKYAAEKEGFLARGRLLKGMQINMGDAAILLKPFPRIAVAVVLWLKDDEFPARCAFLVDSSCDRQLPADIMWLTAMMCVQAMLC